MATLKSKLTYTISSHSDAVFKVHKKNKFGQAGKAGQHSKEIVLETFPSFKML